MSVKIALSGGLAALVDPEDFADVSAYVWGSTKGHAGCRYAARRVGTWPQSDATVLMHRQILSLEDPAIHVDHIDGNGLNNCRSNLRLATREQNQGNSVKRAAASSMFKGVYLHKRGWIARIGGSPRRQIGTFASEIDAARAYDAAARVRYGQFARLNFPVDGEQCALVACN